MQFATERLIDSVWTMEYEVEGASIRIHRYDRQNPIGYEQEKELPRLRVHEDENRTVKGVWIAPYSPYESRANRQRGQYYPVLNPKNIFRYDGTKS